MFNSITWGQYFYGIISLLIIYYAVIGFKFYKWEILAAIGIRKVDNATLNTVSLSGLKKYVSPENDEDYQPKQSKATHTIQKMKWQSSFRGYEKSF